MQPVSEPTPKPKSNIQTPLLLKLDIDGRGPSLGDDSKSTTSTQEDDDPFPTKQNTVHLDHPQQPATVPPVARQIITTEEDDPYSSSNDDEDDDSRSVQYAGSSCDGDHQQVTLPPQFIAQPIPSTSPYMKTQISTASNRKNIQPPRSFESTINNANSNNIYTNNKHGLASKKSFNFFKLSSNSPASSSSIHQPNDSNYPIYQGGVHSSQSSFKPVDLVDPSPVSSLTSFNTTGSKASSKASSSSRMARLLSRVTGGGGGGGGGGGSSSTGINSNKNSTNSVGNGNSNSSLPRPQMPKSSFSQPRSTPALPTTKQPSENKPPRRKGSISNFLDTISISRDRGKPSNPHPSQTAAEPTPNMAPRKSFDMLMRPFLGSKHKAQPSDLNPSLGILNSDGSSPPGHQAPQANLPCLPPPPTPTPPSRPLLKAKRSYDMLRSKLGNGRKNMDDFSSFGPPPPAASESLPSSLSSAQQPTKQIMLGPTLLSESPAAVVSLKAVLPSLQSAPSVASINRGNQRTSNPTNKQLAAPAPVDQKLTTTTTTANPPRSTSRTDHNQHLLASTPAPTKLISKVLPSKDPSQPRVIDHSQSFAEWNTLETILNNFQALPHTKQGRAASENSRTDLTLGLTNHLLPFLKTEEGFYGSVYLDQNLAAAHRNILLGWLGLIFDELREPQPTSRAACLDGVSGILESHFFASHNINSSPEALKQYRSVLVTVLSFAIDKLNDKAVYANTLVFAGRMLSLAFFRIEGVGRKLLRALPPVKRMSMRRLLDEMMESHETNTSSEQPPNLQPFPPYLRELCFVDLPSYCHVFSSPSLESDNLLVQEGDIQVEMSGNWLIRWTASDSDLPFAFYRAYHRQLATYLRPQERHTLPPSTLISMPGFLLVAASFLDKCDSLVHRSLRSVTTLGPTANNFSAGESANLAMGAKPKVLELAHRRLVSTALDIVGGSPKPTAGEGQDEEEDSISRMDDAGRRRQFFGGLLNLWIRAIAKRTSMWDTRSVFLLLDLLDGLFYTVLYTAPSSPPSQPSPPDLPVPPAVPKLAQSSLQLFDFHFILDVLRRILISADNTVCIMRTIAFIYSQFEALTTLPETLKALCLDLLLDPHVFQHLFLHWNSGVRGYYMRLLIWRLSRLNGSSHSGQKTAKSKDVVKIILTFNSRLEAIRKRHDQLSPLSEMLSTQEEEDRRRKRTTICSTRGVSEKPWAIPESPSEEVCVDRLDDGTFRDLGGGGGGGSSDKPSVAKVVSWLKVVKRLGGSSKLKHRQDSPSSSDTGHESSRLTLEQSRPSQSNQEEREQTTSQLGVSTGSRSKVPAAQTGAEGSNNTNRQWLELSEMENEWNERKSQSSQRSSSTTTAAHASGSPTFFQFEFELGAAEIPRSDSFDTPLTTPSHSEPIPNNNPTAALTTTSTTPATTTTSTTTANVGETPTAKASLEPRVSSRFSKRASILPPAALDMLKDNNTGSDGEGETSSVPAVPSVPSQYKQASGAATQGEQDEIAQQQQQRRLRQKEKEERLMVLLYPPTKQAYAVKALAEYEQSLEEELEWKEKLLQDHFQQLQGHAPAPAPSAISSNDMQSLETNNQTNIPTLVLPPSDAAALKSDDPNAAASAALIVDAIVPRLAVTWPLSFSEDE